VVGGASRTSFSCAAVAEREKGRSRGAPASARPDAESVSQSAAGGMSEQMTGGLQSSRVRTSCAVVWL
jgi:hypothetical protein